jgi:hypothetical protein
VNTSEHCEHIKIIILGQDQSEGGSVTDDDFLSDDEDDSLNHDEDTPLAPVKGWDVFEVSPKKFIRNL